MLNPRKSTNILRSDINVKKTTTNASNHFKDASV